jgi:hypothetical protein
MAMKNEREAASFTRTIRATKESVQTAFIGKAQEWFPYEVCAFSDVDKPTRVGDGSDVKIVSRTRDGDEHVLLQVRTEGQTGPDLTTFKVWMAFNEDGKPAAHFMLQLVGTNPRETVISVSEFTRNMEWKSVAALQPEEASRFAMDEFVYYASGDYVLYVFGAGASAHCIPPVAGFRTLANEVLDWAKKQSTSQEERPSLSALQSLCDGLVDSPTPDTLAREHYLRQRDRRPSPYAKATEMVFAAREKLGYEILATESNKKESEHDVPPDRHFDLRYLNWLLGIAEPIKSGGVRFPRRIGVMTWNYDTGIIRALARVYDSLRSARGHLVSAQGISKVQSELPVFPINGYARSSLTDPTTVNSQGVQNAQILDEFDRLMKGSKRTAIRFAWLLSIRNQKIMNVLARRATCMVFIGYSFPNYNAAVDIEMIGTATRLKSVYVQTHRSSETSNVASIATTRLFAAGRNVVGKPETNPNGRKPVEIVEIANPHQFLIPPEAARVLWA